MGARGFFSALGIYLWGGKNCGVSRNREASRCSMVQSDPSQTNTDNRISRPAREPEFCHVRTMAVEIYKLEIGYVYATLLLVYNHCFYIRIL